MIFDPEAAPWRKSSYSGGPETSCVEVAPLAGVVGVRDTKNRTAGHIAVPASAWRAFVSAAKTGGQ